MTITRRPARVRRVVAVTLVVALLLLALELTGGLAVRRWRDAGQQVSADRLAAALLTFRPAERAGQTRTVDPADLDPGKSARATPARCDPLVLLGADGLDAQSWTGISGTPAQPVTTLTVRYADADVARDELTTKRLALLRCARVGIVFPPFDQPAQEFTVGKPHWLGSVAGDEVQYALTGDGRRFEFYVRRYANTVTWSYADDVSTPQVRRQVVDDLVDRLQEIARE